MADAERPDDLAAAFLATRPTLLRLLVARLGSPEEAEDALQDMWLRLERIDGGGIDQPAAFLYRMAANLATDRRIAAARRGAREDAWLALQPGADEFADAERLMIARDRLAAVEAVMHDMPERMRTALTMFRIEEQPQRTIAGRLGITVSGVEKLLRRAYRLLNAAVAEPGADMPPPHRQEHEGSRGHED